MRKKGETGVQDRTKPPPMQKKEKRSVRRKSLTDLNDNDPDKLCARCPNAAFEVMTDYERPNCVMGYAL